jgi:hypothetical protein
MSLCGLRGINLSGGQRQRVNVARAAYVPSDLILLDNALSAVDHHTAHDMFRECLRGRMADKAVIFITHQVEVRPPPLHVARSPGFWCNLCLCHHGPGCNLYTRDLLNQTLSSCSTASHLPCFAVPSPHTRL